MTTKHENPFLDDYVEYMDNVISDLAEQGIWINDADVTPWSSVLAFVRHINRLDSRRVENFGNPVYIHNIKFLNGIYHIGVAGQTELDANGFCNSEMLCNAKVSWIFQIIWKYRKDIPLFRLSHIGTGYEDIDEFVRDMNEMFDSEAHFELQEKVFIEEEEFFKLAFVIDDESFTDEQIDQSLTRMFSCLPSVPDFKNTLLNDG